MDKLGKLRQYHYKERLKISQGSGFGELDNTAPPRTPKEYLPPAFVS